MRSAAALRSGSSARAAATSATRASRRGISGAGLQRSAARSARVKNGSATPGLVSVRSTASRQSSTSPVDSSPLVSMSQAVLHRDRPRQRVGQLGRVAEQGLQRLLVGAHGREGEVAVVEQVQVGRRELGQPGGRAGRQDVEVADPLQAAVGPAGRTRSAAGAAAAGRRRGWSRPGPTGRRRARRPSPRPGSGCRCRPGPSTRSSTSRGRVRRRSPTAPIRSVSSVLPQAWSRK